MSKNRLEKMLGESTVLVVLVPSLAYFLTYCFQLGYCSYYNIPVIGVRISTDDVLGMMVVLGLSLIVLIAIDTFFSNAILKHFFKHYPFWGNVYAEQYKKYIFLFLLCVLFAIANLIGPLPKSMNLYFVIPIIVIIVSFLVQHICFRVRSRRNNAGTKFDEDPKETEPPITGFVESILGWRTISFILLLGMLFLFFFLFGSNEAAKNKKFYAIEGRPEVIGVVVSDHFIVAKSKTDASLEYTELISFEDGIAISEIESEEFFKLVKDYKEEKRNQLNSDVINENCTIDAH